jgi:hypothetical protein
MGRLEHLKLTLPLSLSHKAVEVLLVDYSCPERAGDWAERTFTTEIQAGRLRIIRVRGRTEYHQAHAKNVSHMRAHGELLVNADADNFIDQTYFDKCVELFREPSIQIVQPAGDLQTAHSGMFGRLAIRRWAYHALGGYDEDLVGWGNDDNNLVWRAQALGIRVATIPFDFLKVIEHDDELRTRFMLNRDKNDSNRRNAEISVAKLTAGELVANQGRAIGAI